MSKAEPSPLAGCVSVEAEGWREVGGVARASESSDREGLLPALSTERIPERHPVPRLRQRLSPRRKAGAALRVTQLKEMEAGE